MGFFVPTRGQVYHETATRLAQIGLLAEIGLPSYVWGNASVATTRNEIVQRFLESEGAWLLMCDDDVIPPFDLAKLWVQDEFEICAAICPMLRPGGIPMPNAFGREDGAYVHVFGSGLSEVDAVGTGCIAIRREVLLDKHLKAPFRPATDKTGVLTGSEDISFCERARARGWKIGAHFDLLCEHMVLAHMNALSMAYLMLYGQTNAGDEDAEDEREGALR